MAENPLRAGDMRQHNSNIILSRIQAAGSEGVSQSEMVTRTGLKAPTVFRIFSSLEDQGLIVQTDTPEPQGERRGKGRKPVSYRIKKGALYTIGIEFWSGYITLGVFDFTGERIHTESVHLPAETEASEAVEKIVSMIEAAIETLSLARKKIIGIGVAAPGLVNVKEGVVVYYGRMKGMRNYPLAEELTRRLGIKTIVTNNCSALALAEYKYGNLRHTGSLFVFLLRMGVNGAFISDGSIYLNSKGLTLETGHIPLDTAGPLCSCGAHGCLQAYLGELDGEKSLKGITHSMFADLEDRLKSGDGDAEKILDEASRSLYLAGRTIQRFLSPDSFLVVCGTDRVTSFLTERIRARFAENTDYFEPNPPLVLGKTFDPLMSQLGASDLVLRDFFGE